MAYGGAAATATAAMCVLGVESDRGGRAGQRHLLSRAWKRSSRVRSVPEESGSRWELSFLIR